MTEFEMELLNEFRRFNKNLEDLEKTLVLIESRVI